MAVDKNKRISKKSKGGRKKKADAFEKKSWFKLRMPRITGIYQSTYGWTCANKTAQGITVESRLQDRVCTIRCGDLTKDALGDSQEDMKTATNLKLRVAMTKEDECFLDFHGMELTRDKTCSLLRKWVTLVEARTDIKTTDGFVFRCFAVALTKRQEPGQCKKSAYAKTSQVKRMRAKMIEIMNNILGDKSTKFFVGKILADSCSKQFHSELEWIFPVKDAVIKKVKLIKRPAREDLHRIQELHTENTQDADDMED